jgi:3-hydroxymyristoyl/3-hydroxydecanoyl-(acyl carrier protein) dehydratase
MLEQQVGLPCSAADRSWLERPCDRPAELRSPASQPRLAGPMLLMLDRITGYWPDGGAAGLGRLRAEKDVDPGEWFFKAHFFTDPVQPGSLGVEAMCQLLQWYLLERGMAADVPRPRFEPVLTGHQLTWKYRGQVVPANERITIEMEITELAGDERGRYAIATAWLWVDGLRIYQVRDLGMRVAAGRRLNL